MRIPYFKLFAADYEQLKACGLTHEEMGTVFAAIIAYGSAGTLPYLPTPLMLQFMILKTSADRQIEGAQGAAKRWGNKEKIARDMANELDKAFESCMESRTATARISDMAEYMDLKPDTVRRRLRADGRYWIEAGKTGRKLKNQSKTE